MRNAENYQEVCTKKKGVKTLFAKCFQTYHEYYQVVDLQKVTSDALNACRSIIGKKKFNERFEEWSWSIQRTADETLMFPC